MNHQKGFVNVILMVILVVIIGAVGYFIFIKKPSSVVQPPPVTQISCGTVDTQGSDLPSYNKDAQKVEDCFWTNFKSGIAATLTLHYMGVDAGSYLYFSTECTSGKCKISAYGQSYSANFGGSKSAKDTFTCANLTKNSSGLHALQCKFKDSTRDILIPTYQNPTIERVSILTQEQAMDIAFKDFSKSNNRADFNVGVAPLADAQWQVIIFPKQPGGEFIISGGNGIYVIDGRTGAILSKQFGQ